MDGNVLQRKRAKRDTIIRDLKMWLSGLEETEKDMDAIYEEGQALGKTILQLREDMKQEYQGTVGKQQEMIREKDRKILDLEEKQGTAEKANRELEEELCKVRGDNLKLQEACHKLKKEKEELEEEKASAGGKISQLENDLDSASQEKEKLEKENHTLSIEKEGLKKSLADVQEEKQDAEDGLKSAKAQIQALKDKLDTARQDLEAAGELRRPLEAYRKCREWSGDDKVILNIQDSDFTTFLFECREKMAVYYKNAEKVIKKAEVSLESVERINEIIDCGIELNRKTKGRGELRRQEVRVGDEYNERLHKRSEGNSYNGTIVKVHLQGILNGEKTLDGCRAYVEIESQEEHD